VAYSLGKSLLSTVTLLVIMIRNGTRLIMRRRYRGTEYCDEPACQSVCLSARAYLANHTTKLRQIFCERSSWPWLGPCMAALRYVMYFRFAETRGRHESAAASLHCVCGLTPLLGVIACILTYVRLNYRHRKHNAWKEKEKFRWRGGGGIVKVRKMSTDQ